MARIDNTTNLLEAQLIIRRLRHELSQYETLLGVKPFDIDLLKGDPGLPGPRGLDGDNSYQVWLKTNPGGTFDQYEAWLQQPAIDAKNQVLATEAIIQSNENVRIQSEQTRVNNENLRNTAENTRVSNENQRISNENSRQQLYSETSALKDSVISARDSATQAATTANEVTILANNAATNANDKATLADTAAQTANTAAGLADTARLNIQTDLAKKAEHGYTANPKTLKQVDDAVIQLASYKQNSLNFDGTGTKYPTVDAVNAGLALKQDANLLATYVHSGNKEIYISSIDYSTNTFISVGHGLTNNTDYINNICVALNKNELIYPIDVLPFIIETSDYFGYYIVNATTDTFQISRTEGGTPITLTDKVTNDLTKWHFERGATRNNATLSITGLLGKIDDGCKTIVEGTLLWGYACYIGAKHNLGRVYAKHTDGPNVAYNYATIYGRNDFPIPCFGGNIVHTDIYTPNGHRKIFDINVTSFSSTANRIGVMTKIITYVSPITVTEVKDRVNISFLPANGTIIKVYKL